MNPVAPPRRHWTGNVLLGICLAIPCSLILCCLWPRDWGRRDYSRRNATLNNLRNVGIAVQAYATTFLGWVPAGGSVEDVLPEWSWQTQLLPYLEQQALYRKIDFTRAWNSPENTPLSAISISILLGHNNPNRGPVDGFGITHFTGSSRVFTPRVRWTLDDISMKDGTSATLLLGEIASACPPWARPGNTRDPARGLAGGVDQFGTSPEAPCAVMFVGGSSRYLSPDISPRVLELLADPDNGVPTDVEY